MKIRPGAVASAVAVAGCLALSACSSPSGPAQPFTSAADLLSSIHKQAAANDGIRFTIDLSSRSRPLFSGGPLASGEGIVHVGDGTLSAQSKNQYDQPDRIREAVEVDGKVYLRTYPGNDMIPSQTPPSWNEFDLSSFEVCGSFDWWVLLELHLAYDPRVLGGGPTSVINAESRAGQYTYTLAVDEPGVISSISGRAPKPGDSQCSFNRVTFVTDALGKLRSQSIEFDAGGEDAELRLEYVDWQVDQKIDTPSN